MKLSSKKNENPFMFGEISSFIAAFYRVEFCGNLDSSYEFKPWGHLDC